MLMAFPALRLLLLNADPFVKNINSYHVNIGKLGNTHHSRRIFNIYVDSEVLNSRQG